MAELLLELFSEEIPARMQARAAEDLKRLLTGALASSGVVPQETRIFYGPRRIGLSAQVPAITAEEQWEERGPRQGVPKAVLAAFIRTKVAGRFGALDEALQQEAVECLARGEAYAAPDRGKVVRDLRLAWRPSGKTLALVASAIVPGRSVSSLLAETLPGVLRSFPWPKSMRWGRGGSFTWVRPLKRILCLLDGAVVPFDLRQGEDDAHGLRSGDETEGHRIMAPGAFAVRSAADYVEGLRARKVVVEAEERARIIREGVARLAAAEGFEVVPDEGLLTEVAGLVEWPVPLLGRIDDAFMDLPPEVMRTTMRVNQRYFALRTPDGRAAPRFAVVANVEARDGGAAIVAGNERVLRARLSDARFFWDQDRKERLVDRLPKLDQVVFHAKLGSQGERVKRLEWLAEFIAPLVGANRDDAVDAARLAKADLVSGMVGEFPELQGVMGRYYALEEKKKPEVAEAIAAHYRPLGPNDAVPDEPVAIAVALADKLDQLAGFFAVGERPTGSGDPFALRRAALGVIRIVRENGLRLGLLDLFEEAIKGVLKTRAPGLPPLLLERVAAPSHPGRTVYKLSLELLDFLAERLRVQLRTEGARHDIVAAVFGATPDDDLNRLLRRAEAVRAFLATEDGANLLTAHRRAANILRIEERKDGHAYDTGYERHLLKAPEEEALAEALETAADRVERDLAAEDFERAMDALAALRGPVDAFFDRVTVNDPAPELRRNRLRLLARLRAVMDAVADFSKVEG
ncbi:MAG: glycine--tRNA ligase subunit beta [Acetobacteraceae bacterium]|nr:glycine--tRNA ligase subunit beta [Acetobacteraceae bacterium]